MSDLVSRLLAAIEETERLANACEGRPWEARFGPSADEDEPEHWVAGLNMGDTVAVCGEDYTMARHHAAHIAHNDPAAVLRRCRLDRDTVQDYQRALGRPDYSPGAGDVLFALRMVVTRLALAYGISVEEETTGE